MMSVEDEIEVHAATIFLCEVSRTLRGTILNDRAQNVPLMPLRSILPRRRKRSSWSVCNIGCL